MEELTAHPHDSIIRLEQADLDQILETAERIAAQDIPTVLNYLDSLNRVGQTTWFAMAHIMYLLSMRWDADKYGEFYETMAIKYGKSAETTRRMVEIWRWVIVEPKHSKKRLAMILSKPPSGLWYVKSASKEGQLGEEEWKRIERAPNKQELRQIMLDVRGEYRRGKDALKIMIEEDGILKARKGNKAYAYVGRLNVEMEDPVVVEAIERIINSSGVFRR